MNFWRIFLFAILVGWLMIVGTLFVRFNKQGVHVAATAAIALPSDDRWLSERRLMQDLIVNLSSTHELLVGRLDAAVIERDMLRKQLLQMQRAEQSLSTSSSTISATSTTREITLKSSSLATVTPVKDTTVPASTLARSREQDESRWPCGLQAPQCRHPHERFLTYTQGGGFNNQRQSLERAFQVSC
jgi:hypothetical protein